jgi:hypothetical protein
MDKLVTRQKNGRQYASKLPRYFSLFIVATAFSLYFVSSPIFLRFTTQAIKRLVQYSDIAGQVVRVWLGQDGGPSRPLPGWSPSSYIGLEADIEKRDAVVAAFRVRLSPQPLLHGSHASVARVASIWCGVTLLRSVFFRV